jgi:cob(I)alamin adenosyltransferase
MMNAMSLPARILIFTGDGKGKTTAALGLALRAAGHGMRTCVVQFIKVAESGEHQALQHFSEIEIVQAGRGFSPPRDHPAFIQHKEAAEEGLRKAAQAIASGRFQVIVLDEICLAVAEGLLEEQTVIEILRMASADQVLVLTGRGAGENLIKLADTVTEMLCLKHGFADERPAQKGVEL